MVNENWRYILEIKLPERNVDHSPSYSAEVKNEWSYNFTSPLHLRDVDRHKFIF